MRRIKEQGIFFIVFALAILTPGGRFIFADTPGLRYVARPENFPPAAAFTSQPSILDQKTAELKLSTSTEAGVVTAGEMFRIRLDLDPGGQPVNTTEVGLSYSTSTLKLLAIDYASSSFSICLDQDQTEGRAAITCFQPAPGIVKPARVVDLEFIAIGSGAGELVFSGIPAVLANDGFGTNILKRARDLRFEVYQK